MFRRPGFVPTSIFAGLLAVVQPDPIQAGVVAGFVPTSPASHNRHDLYSSGFSNAPVRNSDPSFLGNGWNLTGIGFMANNGSQGVTMISPQHFVMTAHFPPSTNQISFVTAANQIRTYTIQSTTALSTTTFNGAPVNATSDLLIGRLTAPIPAGDGIGFLPIAFDPSVNLNTGPIPTQNGYNSLPVFAQGFNGTYTNSNGFTSPHWGTNVTDRGPNLTVDAGVNSITFGYDFNSGINGEFHSISGDSGSPSLTTFGGQLSLVGLHYDLLADLSSIDLLLAYYIPQMNSFMQPDGFQVTVANIPEPSAMLLVGLVGGIGVWRRSRRIGR